MCLDVWISVGDSGEVSPTAHQRLNIAVLHTLLYCVFEEGVDP